MNRLEALRILGLDEDATIEDVKIAYKEMAQILHPDRFASKKKLQDRATDQFKLLREAYDYLVNDKLGAQHGTKSSPVNHGYSPRNAYEARMAGIAAARTQLIAQRDMMLDERRNALIIGAIGAIIAIFFRRFPIGLALGSTAVIWGVVKLISVLSTIKNLDEHIKRLREEEQKIAEDFDDLS